MRLKDRVSIITGAAQGIGAATAREFAREGALVNAIDIKPEVDEVCRAIREGGAQARAYQLDITDAEAYRRCVEDVAARHGRIDALVNNAAISYYADLLNDTREQWQHTLAVNLEAVYTGCKLAAPHMAKQRRGWIVNITSIQALETDGRVGPYAASKGALISFTKSLAVDLAPHGILANAIAPGCIHTPLSVIEGVDETTTEFFKTWYVGHRKIPLARPGEPEEIARVAVFLCTDDVSYMTGATLVVDGGLTSTF